MYDYTVLGHDIFIAFLECKIEGDWERQRFKDPYDQSISHWVLSARKDNCLIKVIELDGLRRIFQITERGTINMHENVLSYHSDQVQEIIVDEKEQTGKGSSRDKL